MPPPAISPDQIRTTPRGTKVLQMDANVVAYFGDLFQALRKGLKVAPAPPISALPKPAQTAPASTASAQNRS